jgi:hypothetical protein
MSQTHFIHTHATSKILPSHQGILCQLMVLLTLVCAQNCLVVAVLTKVLSPCVDKIIQAWNEFLVQECWSHNTSGPLQQGGGTHRPWGKGLLSTPPLWNYPGWSSKLLEIRPLRTTGVTIEDTETENCLSKGKFTSTDRCTGTWVQQAHRKDNRSSFLFLIQWALSLYSYWLSLGPNLLMIS